MNRDDIIRMAREAGLMLGSEQLPWGVERFAALIAAAERERVAGYMTRRGFKPTSTNDIVEMLEEMFWFSEERFLKSVRTQVVGDALVAAVKAEREACAKVCDEKVNAEYATGKVDHNEMGWTQACAIAIRARGES